MERISFFVNRHQKAIGFLGMLLAATLCTKVLATSFFGTGQQNTQSKSTAMPSPQPSQVMSAEEFSKAISTQNQQKNQRLDKTLKEKIATPKPLPPKPVGKPSPVVTQPTTRPAAVPATAPRPSYQPQPSYQQPTQNPYGEPSTQEKPMNRTQEIKRPPEPEPFSGFGTSPSQPASTPSSSTPSGGGSSNSWDIDF